MTEIWKVVPEYPLYEASTEGRIRWAGTDRIKGQSLTGIPQYYYTGVKDIGMRRVHRLVAMAHIPNPKGLEMVDHINQDKLDNRVENLRWVTRSQNQRNKHNNKYLPDGRLVIEACEEVWGEGCTREYGLVAIRLDKGIPFEEAVLQVREQREYGVQTHILGNGQYLRDLVGEEKYQKVLSRIKQGWPEWNALYNCPEKYPHSYESLGMWFPSSMEVANEVGLSRKTVTENILKHGIEALLDGSYKRHPDVFTLNYMDSVYIGTVAEIAALSGLERDSVVWKVRHKDDSKKTRSLKASINGVVKRKKAWCEEFGIKRVSLLNWVSCKPERDFQAGLEHYGVDTSEMEIFEL
mgnify:CR=1 FL=1